MEKKFCEKFVHKIRSEYKDQSKPVLKPVHLSHKDFNPSKFDS